MRRVVTAVVAVCVCLFGLRASALHVHAYVDHDHVEHHHGPEAHDHQMPAGADEVTHIDACDPAAHIVSIAYLAVPTTDLHPVVGEIVMTTVMPRAADGVRAVQLLDVRGHGPPHARFNSLRAPPS